MALRYLMCLAVLLTGMSALAESPTPVIREEHKVVVDGVEEHWRLEWASPPKPACPPDDPVWMTCPCSGFAFGERGNLVLVRRNREQMKSVLRSHSSLMESLTRREMWGKSSCAGGTFTKRIWTRAIRGILLSEYGLVRLPR